MNFLTIYVYFIRATLIALSAYHLYKHQNKVVASAVGSFILTFLPNFLQKIMNIRLDAVGYFVLIAIIFMTVYLGSALKYYDKYPWWDRLIHFLSGIAFVSFGIAISKNIKELNSLHILFFSFTFSITLHTIWEVLEYIFDSLFHMDNQRWQKHSASNNHQPPRAIQPPGLVDTMNDAVVCIIGTAVSCIVWWFIWL